MEEPPGLETAGSAGILVGLSHIEPADLAFGCQMESKIRVEVSPCIGVECSLKTEAIVLNPID